MICDMSWVVPLASLIVDHRLLLLSDLLSVPEEGADEGGEVQVAVGPCPMGGPCTLGLSCRYSDHSQPPSGVPLTDLGKVYQATTGQLETPAPLPAPRPPLACPALGGCWAADVAASVAAADLCQGCLFQPPVCPSPQLAGPAASHEKTFGEADGPCRGSSMGRRGPDPDSGENQSPSNTSNTTGSQIGPGAPLMPQGDLFGH